MTAEALSHWEGATAEELASAWGLPRVHLFARVGSTNDEARRLAAEGAPPGTLVLAERQLAGRGRAGRAWHSPADLGLWLSLVLRPEELPAPGAVPLRVGLAVAEALDPFLRPASLRIKWPNDLLAGDGKIGGILCEGAWERGRRVHLVAGVGLNVLHAPADFPEGIREAASSVRIAAGRGPDRREVAGAVAVALAGLLGAPLELAPRHLAALEARDALRGCEVTVTEPTTGAPLARGTALGVAPDGSLLLRTEAGAIRPVHSGTVRLASPHPRRFAPPLLPQSGEGDRG